MKPRGDRFIAAPMKRRPPSPPDTRAGGRTSRVAAFTLLELLVVLAITAGLVGVLVPAWRGALERGWATQCRANLRQLAQANGAHAASQGVFAAAAPDIFTTNRIRWHGARSNSREAFRAGEGTLSDYIGNSAAVRRCMALRDVRRGRASNAFEESCGGYGYNLIGVGSRACAEGFLSSAMARGMAAGEMDNPAGVVMFADTAFPQPYGNPDYLIEYSFAEPPHPLQPGSSEDAAESQQPSIHFRHPGRTASVVWADGHADERTLDPSSPAVPAKFDIGWFAPPDNSAFRAR